MTQGEIIGGSRNDHIALLFLQQKMFLVAALFFSIVTGEKNLEVTSEKIVHPGITTSGYKVSSEIGYTTNTDLFI